MKTAEAITADTPKLKLVLLGDDLAEAVEDIASEIGIIITGLWVGIVENYRTTIKMPQNIAQQWVTTPKTMDLITQVTAEGRYVLRSLSYKNGIGIAVGLVSENTRISSLPETPSEQKVANMIALLYAYYTGIMSRNDIEEVAAKNKEYAVVLNIIDQRQLAHSATN